VPRVKCIEKLSAIKKPHGIGVLCGGLFLVALWFTWRDLAVSVRDDCFRELVDAFSSSRNFSLKK
jgi:branched-subunit amino acid transport protein AzlD